MDLIKLSGIGNARRKYLNELGIKSISDLASAEVDKLWVLISRKKEGKILFQTESTVKILVENAHSRISDGLSTLHSELTSIPHLKETRIRYLNKLGIKTIKKLANTEVRELWEKISKDTQGKIIFQQEHTIQEIIWNARSRILNKPIPLSSVLTPFNLKRGDAFFDLEYDTTITPPLIFAICFGRYNKNMEIHLHTWFAENKNDMNDYLKKFYGVVESSKVKRLIGWSIFSADLPQLEKVSQLPENLEFLDLYQEFKQRVSFPIKSYRLKDIAQYIFPDQIKRRINSGFDAIIFYRNYLKNRNLKVKELLIEYIREDVQITFEMAKWLEKFSKQYC